MRKTFIILLMTMIINSVFGQDLSGTWIMTKDGFTYGQNMVIEFKDDQILHYDILQKSSNGTLEKKLVFSEKISETKNEFVNENRIRLYRMGKTHMVISETESRTEDTEFATDYERIEPTKTKLSAVEIEKLDFNAEWNNEKIHFIFNKNLDSPKMQEIYKRLNREEAKIFLENLNGTYFGAFYTDGYRDVLLPIREIDTSKVILYGFPEEPYEITGI